MNYLMEKPWQKLGISEEKYDAMMRGRDPYYRSNRDNDPYYRTEQDQNPYYRDPDKDSTQSNPDGGAGW